jgi:flagellar biosynthesis anti-sigma factor FlgM
MDIRNSLEGLKSLLGVAPTSPAEPRPARSVRADQALLGNDHATLSSAASEVSQAAGEDGVRMEKVAGIRAALGAGSYDVHASAVATKLIDTMLGGQR